MTQRQINIKRSDIAEVILVLFGIFLIIDSLFLHLITLVYPENIRWLDPYIDHWMIGAILISIVAWTKLRK